MSIEPNHKVIKMEYWELLPGKEEPYAGRSGSRELCAVTGARSRCMGVLGSPWKHAHNERLKQHLLPPPGCSRVRCPNCGSAGGWHCPGHLGSVTAAFALKCLHEDARQTKTGGTMKAKQSLTKQRIHWRRKQVKQQLRLSHYCRYEHESLIHTTTFKVHDVAPKYKLMCSYHVLETIPACGTCFFFVFLTSLNIKGFVFASRTPQHGCHFSTVEAL